MSTTQVLPRTIRSSVHSAVRNGAWGAADVVRTVSADTAATRPEVIATLWDLVDEGQLEYSGTSPFPVFRPARHR